MNFTEALASVIRVPNFSAVVWTASVPVSSPLLSDVVPRSCVLMLISSAQASVCYPEPPCCPPPPPSSLKVLLAGLFQEVNGWGFPSVGNESLHSVYFWNYQKVLYMCCQEVQESHLACNSLCCGSIIHLDQSPKYSWLNFFTQWPARQCFPSSMIWFHTQARKGEFNSLREHKSSINHKISS